tara:strand:- start:22 stop:393 length:372 start_codon:yes stop_codon:yes gene_type:complete
MGLIDDLFTSDEERAEAKVKLLEMEQKGELAQIAVNMQEAKSEHLFVSGWRPAVGWVCVAAFAYTFILMPFGSFIALVSGMDPALLAALPDLDIGSMMPVLLGMLGLGAMRSYEKKSGTNKNR